MKSPIKFLVALCGLLALGSAFAADPAPVTIDPEADRLLKAASAHLAAAKSFSFQAEVWEDEVIDGHKVTTTKTVVTSVRRPDRLQMEIRSPKRSRGIWYDGKSFTLLARKANLYGTVAAPGTIDQMIDAANDQFGITLPVEDFLVSDAYASAMAGIKRGISFGPVTVLGTICQHIAFSTEKVDFQLWIEDGPNPVPRKFVITYKQEETAPQCTVIFSNWKLSVDLPDNTFAFTAPKAAARVEILPAADSK